MSHLKISCLLHSCRSMFYVFPGKHASAVPAAEWLPYQVNTETIFCFLLGRIRYKLANHWQNTSRKNNSCHALNGLCRQWLLKLDRTLEKHSVGHNPPSLQGTEYPNKHILSVLDFSTCGLSDIRPGTRVSSIIFEKYINLYLDINEVVEVWCIIPARASKTTACETVQSSSRDD